MSEDLHKLLSDTRNFWELPTVDHDLRTLSKADPPIIRKYTINPRMPIHKNKILQEIFKTNIDLVLETIGWGDELQKNYWLNKIRSDQTPENIVAKIVFTQTLNIVYGNLLQVIEQGEEAKRQEKIAYLKRTRKGAELQNATPQD